MEVFNYKEVLGQHRHQREMLEEIRSLFINKNILHNGKLCLGIVHCQTFMPHTLC